ncbi:MAG: hypothetical protein ACK4MI_13425 [Brevundimonas sp.]|uniref:hypothetical protein n=1 Tax=Brevundimonas sp. TaxID=1871086 RepID=UPI0028D44B36|nr:hypothetical protein [uncultured Brevundimonas sp.]
MSKALVSLILLALAMPISAKAQVGGDFEAMAGACEAFVAEGRFPPASGEPTFFLEKGFKSAASTVQTDEVSRTYTLSGTPIDPVRIMVVRASQPGGESCSVLDLNGPEAGDGYIEKARTEPTWTFDSDSNDVNGKGVLFTKNVAESVIYMAIWGTGGTSPISVATYQIGTSD